MISGTIASILIYITTDSASTRSTTEVVAVQQEVVIVKRGMRLSVRVQSSR